MVLNTSSQINGTPEGGPRLNADEGDYVSTYLAERVCGTYSPSRGGVPRKPTPEKAADEEHDPILYTRGYPIHKG